MLASGVINSQGRTFDIAGVNETNTSISTLNGQLKFSYTSEDGKLIQLTKQLNQSDGIHIGDALGISPARENNHGGYAQKTTNGIAKSLTNVDWNNITNVVTKTFTDDNGILRTAVLLPVTMK